MERTAAVLRVLDGEDVTLVAAWLRVRPQQINRWMTSRLDDRADWRDRSGPWSDAELSPAEKLAGCLMVSDARNWSKRRIRITKAPKRRDPRLVSAMYAERRKVFVDLLTRTPPQLPAEVALDQHHRVWGMLSDTDRDELAPAWDAYQIAAECLYDAKQKIAAIVSLVDSSAAREE
jgi:hypothetical protein